VIYDLFHIAALHDEQDWNWSHAFRVIHTRENVATVSSWSFCI